MGIFIGIFVSNFANVNYFFHEKMPTVVKNAEVALTSVVNATLIGLFLFVVELAKESNCTINVCVTGNFIGILYQTFGIIFFRQYLHWQSFHEKMRQ
jgi:hypothetical protein